MVFQPWPELIGCFALYTAALVCMFLSRHKVEVIVSSAVFTGSSVTFALCLYPPHQITFAYLSAAIVLGVLIRKRREFLDTCLKDRFRWICVAASVCIVVGSLVLLYPKLRRNPENVISDRLPRPKTRTWRRTLPPPDFWWFCGPLHVRGPFSSNMAKVSRLPIFFSSFPFP